MSMFPGSILKIIRKTCMSSVLHPKSKFRNSRRCLRKCSMGHTRISWVKVSATWDTSFCNHKVLGIKSQNLKAVPDVILGVLWVSTNLHRSCSVTPFQGPRKTYVRVTWIMLGQIRNSKSVVSVTIRLKIISQIKFCAARLSISRDRLLQTRFRIRLHEVIRVGSVTLSVWLAKILWGTFSCGSRCATRFRIRTVRFYCDFTWDRNVLDNLRIGYM